MPKSQANPDQAKPDTDASSVSPVARFEQSLTELETLVAKMEGGEQGLDESLRSFERGIALYRQCQTALEQAEARVKLLLDPEHPESAKPFVPNEEP